MADITNQNTGRKSLKPLARLTPFLSRYKPQITMALIALALASGSTLIVPRCPPHYRPWFTALTQPEPVFWRDDRRCPAPGGEFASLIMDVAWREDRG
jgi:hypothetical protein